MASTTQIISQPYVAGPQGSLKAGLPIACKSPDEGLRLAERAMQSGSILGAQVARMAHDDDAGELRADMRASGLDGADRWEADMRPVPCVGDRTRLVPGIVEIIKPGIGAGLEEWERCQEGG